LHNDELFVDIPGVTQAALSFFMLTSISRFKLLAPLANRFVGDRDATVGKQLFDLSESEAEPMAQSDYLTEDLRWKMKTAVTGRVGIHHTSLSNPGQLNDFMKREEKG
jgi:hypothetical protein